MRRRPGSGVLTGVLLLSLPALLSGCAGQSRPPVAANPTPSKAPPAAPRVLPTPAPTPKPKPKPAVIDSALTLEQALRGKTFPASIRRDLALVEVEYLGYDGKEHRGQLVAHLELAADLRAIFAELRVANFPIEKVVPVSRYDWSDGASMANNNTSAFNYRIVRGRGGLSQHALGRAIDINPLYNPCIRDGMTFPRGAKWDANVKGTVVEGPVVEAFEKRGWRWGGRWRHTNITDYQHFEKLAPGVKPRFY